MSFRFGNGRGPGHLNRNSAGGLFLPGTVYGADFRQDMYTGPKAQNTNASGGYIDDLAGNWSFVPANQMRRSNKGLLVEGAQTNLIRNNSMQGAVVGLTGSGGVLPTNWTGASVTEIVAVGVRNGIDYVRVRFTGTTGGALRISGEASVAQAAAANLYTSSAYVALVSGSLAPFGGTLQHRIVDLTPTTDAGGAVTFTPPSAPLFNQRSVVSKTTLSGTTSIRPDIISSAATSVFDVTLDIGWPQLEQWNTGITTIGGASSPIRTTGTAATRSADLTVFPAQSFDGRQGTVIATVRAGAVLLSSGTVVAFNNAANNALALQMRLRGIPNETALAATSDNSNYVTSVNGVVAPNLRFVYGFAWATNDAQLAKDGALIGGAGTTQTPAQAVGNGLIGQGSASWNGYIERVSILPRRATNAELQQYSQLAA